MKTVYFVLSAATGLLLAGAGEAAAFNQQVIDSDFLLPAGSRTFGIRYVGKITGIPEGTRRLRVWFPVPIDSTVQSIQGLRFSQPPRLGFDRKYGNRIAYWEISSPGSSLELEMNFLCTRREARLDLEALRVDARESRPPGRVFLKADRLVLVDREMKRLAREITAGKKSTLEQGRAIYDYVLSRMTYDKSHAGWGLGSTRHACDVGMGNCTDFHALFNSLCRAAGIASGFEIGLYLPYERHSAESPGGYHCWALFRVPGKTWVPVDCSEGDRLADRRDFFFGGHTSNRVTLSTGRDLVLEPRQEGPPLNYFVDPYAEADGRPVKTGKTWSFQDLD